MLGLTGWPEVTLVRDPVQLTFSSTLGSNDSSPATTLPVSCEFRAWLTVLAPPNGVPGFSLSTHQKSSLIGTGLAEAVNETMVSRLEAFGTFSKFKRMAMEMISLNMNPEQVNAMREAFECIDTEGTGVLSMAEFKSALKNFKDISNEKASLRNVEESKNHFFFFCLWRPRALPQYVVCCVRSTYDELAVFFAPQVEEIFTTIDQDQVGVISYSEFLAATLNQVEYLRKDRLEVRNHSLRRVC